MLCKAFYNGAEDYIVLCFNVSILNIHCLTYCSFKPRLEENEKRMFANMAYLVRWLDFDSKGENGREYQQDKEQITLHIQAFEIALAEVVRLVYETQVALSGGSQTLPARQRRCVCV